MVGSVDAAPSCNAEFRLGRSGQVAMMVCQPDPLTPLCHCRHDAGSRHAVGTARVTFEAGMFREMNSLPGYMSCRRRLRAASGIAGIGLDGSPMPQNDPGMSFRISGQADEGALPRPDFSPQTFTGRATLERALLSLGCTGRGRPVQPRWQSRNVLYFRRMAREGGPAHQDSSERDGNGTAWGCTAGSRAAFQVDGSGRLEALSRKEEYRPRSVPGCYNGNELA